MIDSAFIDMLAWFCFRMVSPLRTPLEPLNRRLVMLCRPIENGLTMATPPPNFPPGNGPQGGWGPSMPPAPPAPKAPGRNRALLTHGAVAVAALLVGAGIGAIGGGGEGSGDTADVKAAPRPTVTVTATEQAEAEPGPTVTETVTAKPKKTEKAGPASSFSGEGEFLVGEDIKPGTYKTAGPEGSTAATGSAPRTPAASSTPSSPTTTWRGRGG